MIAPCSPSKTDKLIRATRGAHNAILDLEELTQEDLEHFLKCYQNSPKRHGSMWGTASKIRILLKWRRVKAWR